MLRVSRRLHRVRALHIFPRVDPIRQLTVLIWKPDAAWDGDNSASCPDAAILSPLIAAWRSHPSDRETDDPGGLGSERAGTVDRTG